MKRKIIILKEDGLKCSGLSEDITALLCKYPDFEIKTNNSNEIIECGIQGDFFCNSHGEVYPVEIEERLFEFFSKGGGLLHLGGLPFEIAMKYIHGKWVELKRTFGDIRDNRGYGPLDYEMDVFRARLGLTSYAPAFPQGDCKDLSQVFDIDLVGCSQTSENLPAQGLNLATSIAMHAVKPELTRNDHRAYMARPTCRETHIAGKMIAPDNKNIAASLLLTKCWGNPYDKDQSVNAKPWGIYTGVIQDKMQTEIIDAIMNWLSCPVFLKNIELEYASIHQGESVLAEAGIYGRLPEGWSVKGYKSSISKKGFLSGEAIQWDECRVGRKPEAVCMWVEYMDMEDAFLLPVRLEIIDQHGRIRDYTESAFSVWNPGEIQSSSRIKANGKYFDLVKEGSEKSSCWIQGTNWQDRHLFGFTWHNPNPLRIADDARDMAEAGMVIVRPHYMMPGWFRVTPGKVYEETHSELFSQFEMGPEISEKHMRALEAHVTIFASMGLVFMPSVYTNPGIKMGSPGHWMGTSRQFVVRDLIENQKIFARQVMDRFRNIPAISWDLYNEPDSDMRQAGVWLDEMKEIWGSAGHMVGIGTGTMKNNTILGEAADWHSHHGIALEEYHTGKPCLLQEAHNPAPPSYEGDEELEHNLNKAFSMTLYYGGAGVMPWNWNMSYMNWRYGGGFVDFWDLQLGSAVHADGTPRRGKTVLRNWSVLLDGLSFDQSDHRQVVFIYPKACLDGKGLVEYMDLLHLFNIPFCAVNDSDFSGFDLCDTQLVIVPFYGLGFRRSTWDKLCIFSGNGGVVWAHNDNLNADETGKTDLTRNIPELPGKQAIGKGCFIWNMGWNFDKDKDDIADTDLITLLDIINGLNLIRHVKTAIPLNNGEIRFNIKFSRDEKTMRFDWVPNRKLPDRDIVTKIDIVDKQGVLMRGWSGYGEPLETGKINISSCEPLFLIKKDERAFYLAGNNIRISGTNIKPCLKLVDWRCISGIHDIKANLSPSDEDGDFIINLEGWQRSHWVEVNLPGLVV